MHIQKQTQTILMTAIMAVLVFSDSFALSLTAYVVIAYRVLELFFKINDAENEQKGSIVMSSWLTSLLFQIAILAGLFGLSWWVFGDIVLS